MRKQGRSCLDLLEESRHRPRVYQHDGLHTRAMQIFEGFGLTAQITKCATAAVGHYAKSTRAAGGRYTHNASGGGPLYATKCTDYVK